MTSLKVNDEKITGIIPGSYEKITRLWKANDRISLDFDFSGRVVTQNDCQAILRGPLVLARDTRFADGSVYESAAIKQDDGNVELKSSPVKPAGIWMSFTAPLVLGTNLEGEFREARQVNFCDFASAGNTWTEESRYRVWIPVTLNVMKADYKSY